MILAKRALTLFLLLFLLVACQGKSASDINTRPSEGSKLFRVALLLPRAIEADSWTRAGYDGLILIQQELGAEIAYTEAVPEAEFEQVFRQYAEEGYDFIIGHGNQFAPAAERVAAAYPHTAFAIAGKYGGNNNNLGALSLREGEMAYLFGVIAALKSRSRQVGYIGGMDNSGQQEIITLFQRGLAANDPSIELTVDFVGNFTDEAKAHQLAQAQIDAGIDVIFVLAGAAGMGIHAQAEQAGIFTFAWIEDLHHLAPQAVLTSNIQNVALMLLQGATIARKGQWEGKQYKFGLAEGVQQLAPFYGMLSSAEEAHVNAIKSQLLAGEIDTIP